LKYFILIFKNCFVYIGCRNKTVGQILKNLIQTDYFRVSVVDDVEAVEICGALKV
jgi:glycerol-3-phosphate dehydrogenase (NAD+)